MSDEPILDGSTIETLRSLSPGDDTLLREVVGIYLEDTPARLSELDAALGGGDSTAYIRAAHSLKGSSSNMGALRVRTTAAALEQHARSKGLTDTEPLHQALLAAYAEAETALKALLG